jgi:hypothetical protein
MTKKPRAAGLTALLSAICLASISSAQTSWWRTYGGTSNDGGYSVRQTADGGYVMTGYGGALDDFYLIKTDSVGDTLWTRTSYIYDAGYSVQQTSDGGYVVTTYKIMPSPNASMDVCLVRTDALGNTLWTRNYGENRYDDVGRCVQQTPDGGYIIAGYTHSFYPHQPDFYLIRTNAGGDTLWTRHYGGFAADYCYSVDETADGGYGVVGLTFSFGAGDDDIYFVKTDSSGDTLWTKTYGGRYSDEASFVQQTTDGGYVIAGRTYSFGTGTPDYGNVYLVKTDSSGDTLWTRTYGGPLDDVGLSAQQTADGGYIVTGCTYSFGPGTPDSANVYLVKTDSYGNAMWARTFGGTRRDEGYSVQQTADRGYVITGYTYSFGAGYTSDVYLIKTDSLGYVGVEEPKASLLAKRAGFRVQPSPFVSSARVPGHEAEIFTISDVTGRPVAVCRGDRIGAGLRPGVYFLSPVGSKPGKTVTIIKAAN